MPYWRLSTFYFIYFAILGVLLPYWSPYLASIGFSYSQIGYLMAIIMATKMIAPNIWAWLADRRHSSMPLVRLASLLAVLAYTGVFFGVTFWWLALIMVSFTFFWHAVLPQVEVITLNHLGDDSPRYGRVRLWGSLGFIAASLLLGVALDSYPPTLVLPVLLALLASLFLITLIIPERNKHLPEDRASIVQYIVRRPELIAFLFVCFLLQASHAPYYTFYTLYLTEFGYSKSVIGMLWAFGVVCEIGVFLIMHRFLKPHHFRVLLIASCVITGVRWFMISQFPDSMTMLVLAQTLHAISFGLFHGVAVAMIHRYFTGHHQHRGMALYGSVSFGAGGAFGSFASGYSMGWLGPTMTFAIAGLVVWAAALIALVWVRAHFEEAA
ncbi:MAG TPA: MFS transporter [Gammaproteobacteria bacterium]|nr:MFS transporter [Gammaproteobacteria bacterium]